MVTTENLLKNKLNIRHEFSKPFSCGVSEHWVLGINKVMGLDKVMAEGNAQLGFIRLHSRNTDNSITIARHPRQDVGPVIHERTVLDTFHMGKLNFFSVTPKYFDHLEFTVDFPLCENPIKAIKSFSYTYFITIHYTIMKVSSNPIYKNAMASPVAVDSRSGLSAYSANTVNDFRCDIVPPFDTSLESGQPYVSLTNVTMPYRISFNQTLKNLEVRLKLVWPGIDDETTGARTSFDSYMKSLNEKGILKHEAIGSNTNNIVLKPFQNISSEFGDAGNLEELVKILAAALDKVFERLYGKLVVTLDKKPGISGAIKIRKKSVRKGSPVDLRLLIPRCAYIYADFVEANSFVKNESKKLLGILPLQSAYTKSDFVNAIFSSKSVEINSRFPYTKNRANDFRYVFSPPLDTSVEHGFPHVSLTSAIIPAKVRPGVLYPGIEFCLRLSTPESPEAVAIFKKAEALMAQEANPDLREYLINRSLDTISIYPFINYNIVDEYGLVRRLSAVLDRLFKIKARLEEGLLVFDNTANSSPACLCVCADFVEVNSLNDGQTKRLLGIVPMSSSQTIFYNEENPIITRVNADQLSCIRITIEMPNGELFPIDEDCGEMTSLVLAVSKNDI